MLTSVCEAERDEAFKAQEAAEAGEAYAKEQAEIFQQARLKAETQQRKAEEQVPVRIWKRICFRISLNRFKRSLSKP